jgi:DNA repair ATPase RecN
MRDFLNELKELDFTWEISPSNHIKAVAPDGERFVFSIGGKGRSDQNQRALLNRWIKKNTVVTKPADKEEEMAELSEAALVGLKALEAMVYTIQSQSVDPKIVDDLRAELELVHEDNRKLANERERLVAERNELRASIQALEDSNRILTEDARRLNEIAIKFNQLKGMFG